MSIVSDNLSGQNHVYSLSELQQAISQGSIVINGHTKYFYELIKDDNFIKNPELYQVALTCINLAKDLSGRDLEKYEQLVRGYTLLNNPNMTSVQSSNINEDSNTFESTLRDCERKFTNDLNMFIIIRNKLINKPTTIIEEKICTERSKIFLRLNQLDQISQNKETPLSEKGLQILTLMMRSNDEDVQTTWKGIVEKVVDLLHFDATDPKNLQSVENSLLNGEYDETYILNALTNGETYIDGKKETFRELLQDSKILNHPHLYNTVLTVIDSLKNKESLNATEMQQLVTFYEILKSSKVPSLPERRFYQLFTNYTYNNAIAFCENAFSMDFDGYLAAREKVIGASVWLDQFKGKEPVLLEKLNSFSGSYKEQWNAIKTSIFQVSSSQQAAFDAKNQWKELLNKIRETNGNFFQTYEVENYLFRGIIPFSVQNPEDDQEDYFNLIDVEESENIENSKNVENSTSPKIQRDEVSQATLESFKTGLRTGKFSVGDNNFSELYELSLKYNIPSLTKDCISHVLYRSGKITLNTVRFLHKLSEKADQELSDNIKSSLKHYNVSPTNEYLKELINTPNDFKEFIEKSKILNLNKVRDCCESIFQEERFSQTNVRGNLVIPDEAKLTRDELEFVYDQASALATKPEDITHIMDNAIELGLAESASRAYSQLLQKASILCRPSPLTDLEAKILMSTNLQSYLDAIKNYAVKIAQLNPQNEQFKVIAALFDSDLFSPKVGQELFRYLFSSYCWSGTSSSNYWKVRTFNTDDVHPSNKINSLTAPRIIDLYQKSFDVADKLGFNWLKSYFAYHIFSLELISKKLQEELSTLDEVHKEEFISSARSSLSKLLSYPTHELGWSTSNKIVSIENEFRKHLKSSYQFNDTKTSDVVVVLPGSSPTEQITLHLHKNVLKQSLYFQSIFSSGFKETNLSEITVKEEESEALIKLIKFMYDGKLEVDEHNVIAILDLSKKYFIEPYLAIASQVNLWFSSYILNLNNVRQGDDMDIQEWSALLELFSDPQNELLMNSGSLSEDIYKYLILSVKIYMESIDEQKEPNLTLVQAKDRLHFLEHARDTKVDRFIREDIDKFFKNLEPNYEKYGFGTANR